MSDFPDAKPCPCTHAGVMVEVLGAYDGALYHECPSCGSRWHRFPDGHPLRARAERHIATGYAPRDRTPDPARLPGDHTGC